jgi:hypothetical protein
MKPSPPAGSRGREAVSPDGIPGVPGSGAAPPGGRVSWERRVAGWWNSLQMPLAMRISQGMALLLFWVVLIVILLAYWVGYARGVRHGREQVRQDGGAVLPGVVTGVAGVAGPGGAAVAGGAGGGGAGDGGGDPREAGMAYFVVASFSVKANREVARKEARALVGFLGSRGVDAAAVLPHNKGSYEVAVLRAFAPQETAGPAAEEFKQRLRQLGEEYVRLHRVGFDLKNMYPKTQGKAEAPDDVITKETTP